MSNSERPPHGRRPSAPPRCSSARCSSSASRLNAASTFRSFEQRTGEVADRGAALTVASSEHEMLNRLRERHRTEHKREADRREQGALWTESRHHASAGAPHEHDQHRGHTRRRAGGVSARRSAAVPDQPSPGDRPRPLPRPWKRSPTARSRRPLRPATRRRSPIPKRNRPPHQPPRSPPTTPISADDGSTLAAGPGGGSTSSAYDGLIEQAALRHGVDPAILHGLIQQESGFDPNAASGAGASGLTQLMPGTATSMGVADTLNPAESIEGGARYLSQLMSEFAGNTAEALAAYKASRAARSTAASHRTQKHRATSQKCSATPKATGRAKRPPTRPERPPSTSHHLPATTTEHFFAAEFRRSARSPAGRAGLRKRARRTMGPDRKRGRPTGKSSAGGEEAQPKHPGAGEPEVPASAEAMAAAFIPAAGAGEPSINEPQPPAGGGQPHSATNPAQAGPQANPAATVTEDAPAAPGESGHSLESRLNPAPATITAFNHRLPDAQPGTELPSRRPRRSLPLAKNPPSSPRAARLNRPPSRPARAAPARRAQIARLRALLQRQQAAGEPRASRPG